eukprot:CAMPEP_0185186260 /NCGR_PEP_ID=MMETSP1140-20130426/3911_1 /TAXON_ID=298111 /ORGANISM="Pavlova sp., Strain CCMP459" /LENGTH=264 /DNA_ID=CAMNT_0027752529 /DNA_START=16 /DNA_END=811 /DNA_ORIENTATION=-
MADVEAKAKEAARKQYWLPLESNPEVLNEFAAKIGAEPTFAFHDVFGLDPELLAMVPQPVVAVTLLFPSDEMRPAKEAQLRALEEKGYAPDLSVFFMRQYVGNACGTIAAVHALGNNPFVVGSGSPLAAFLAENAQASPAERGASLASAEFVRAATSQSAQQGQTATPGLGDEVNHHFITFVSKDGRCLELDGTKPYPIDHGPVEGDDLLTAAAGVIKREFIDKVPDGTFNVMALATNMDDHGNEDRPTIIKQIHPDQASSTSR